MKSILVFLLLAGGKTFSSEDLDGFTVKVLKKPKVCIKHAASGDFLKVHYVGRFNDENGNIFDSSHNRGHTFDFVLDAGQVIRGYEIGVPGMCLGETRVFVVPPHLGYGDEGSPPVIPPKSTLHFTVDLVHIDKAPKEL